ncbi:MAG TPA: hypothetical protein VF168_07390 [Trueperaceae bacterium]
MARPELFDTAVARALAYADKLGAMEGEWDPKLLHGVLELWYLKTRFAYRIPLDRVIAALVEYPGPGHYWSGGQGGGWVPGENPHP